MICDNCLHADVCGEEGSFEEALTYCADYLGWIPVSERLPEDKQAVLVWCPQYKNIYCAFLENEQWWIFGTFAQIVPNEVIAWMTLPKPYREESEE